ncbi:diguanylate cyclase [Desulfoluna limicola]|uniref:Diguanylate cyclase n=1 Tax=Desulfoluna limicola TaxID=2810562 RepID=A0ABM7PIV0_9BACT|nr:GGDEF domain-containing protein [Desulfoluna limicola]BCS97229.1 diguanylate cyclase [Desulfoluna limicola]
MEIQHNAFAKIIDNIHDGLYIVDKNRVITYWNKAAERITGFSAAEVTGHSCSENILTHIDSEGNSLCTGMCPLAETMADGIMRETEVYLHHKNGQRVPVSVRVTPLTDISGQVVGGIELFTDISSKSANVLKIKELEKLALLDHLTKLANRACVERELTGRLEEFCRYGNPFGIFLMDIDHFKNVNDTYGHDVGDLVLKFVAETFTANSRAFDLYGRWGGEEFIAVIRNITPEAHSKLGDRIRMLIENAYIIHDGKKLHVTISMGATIILKQDTMDSLVKRADTLLYQSKAEGRNRMTYG